MNKRQKKKQKTKLYQALDTILDPLSLETISSIDTGYLYIDKLHRYISVDTFYDWLFNRTKNMITSDYHGRLSHSMMNILSDWIAAYNVESSIVILGFKNIFDQCSTVLRNIEENEETKI